MTFAFDLISDLHVETWGALDWEGQGTAPYCVVAGDVAQDRCALVETLTHLGQCYQAVFYIDGNDEHVQHAEDLKGSYKDLEYSLKGIPNVVYLQNQVVIINGVAILATNGWWTYDFNPVLDAEQTKMWSANKSNISYDAVTNFSNVAHYDAAYLIDSVRKLQRHPDVKSIVIVSHTVPAEWLIEHDLDLINTWRYNCMGNSHLQHVLDADTESKIHTWCFGHYHKNVDRDFAGIRYVNNCRGRKDTLWEHSVYYPKRIEINF